MTKKSKNKQPKWLIVTEISTAVILAIVGAFAGWQAYRLYGSNLSSQDEEEHLIYVYPHTSIDSLLHQVSEYYTIASPWSLHLHAKWMHWPAEGQEYVRTGCYKLPPHMADIDFIRKFRNGWQEPVSLSFRSIRTQGQLSARIAEQLMLDSADIASRLADTCYMAQFGLDIPNAVCLFLPDTYEMWWDITPDAFFQRMKKAHDAFWTDERKQLAQDMGFTPEQVAVIASIVEEETNKDIDKPVVAGLYINRVKKGMMLQADPTVKFAMQDFKLRRILKRHLEVESPYNTYRVAGLPPGPIRIPTAQTLDFTLHPVDREKGYLYMCANSNFDGTHKFARTYTEHLQNAREYQRALNARGIK
ncbi:MAG: endolytic transglycosylase MltG [Paludibacteraceae bacterium]|nr:endolytic transglycosylase MltG [Paludibacteraceae bacterium]